MLTIPGGAATQETQEPVVLDANAIAVFQKDVLQKLRKLLGLFKGKDTSEARQALITIAKSYPN